MWIAVDPDLSLVELQMKLLFCRKRFWVKTKADIQATNKMLLLFMWKATVWLKVQEVMEIIYTSCYQTGFTVSTVLWQVYSTVRQPYKWREEEERRGEEEREEEEEVERSERGGEEGQQWERVHRGVRRLAAGQRWDCYIFILQYRVPAVAAQQTRVYI